MKRILLLLLTITVDTTAYGQYMFDYSDIKAGKFTQKTVSGLRSMNDGEHYTITSEGRIEKYSYKTGEKTAVLFDASQHMQQGQTLSDYLVSPDERKIILTTGLKPIYRHAYTYDHWLITIPAGSLNKTNEKGSDLRPTCLPDLPQ